MVHGWVDGVIRIVIWCPSLLLTIHYLLSSLYPLPFLFSPRCPFMPDTFAAVTSSFVSSVMTTSSAHSYCRNASPPLGTFVIVSNTMRNGSGLNAEPWCNHFNFLVCLDNVELIDMSEQLGGCTDT